MTFFSPKASLIKPESNTTFTVVAGAILAVVLILFLAGPGILSFAQTPVRAVDAFPPVIPAGTRAMRLDGITQNLPIRFEANQGQSNPRVKFLARGNGYTLFLTSQAAVVNLQSLQQPVESGPRQIDSTALRMEFAGSTGLARIVGLEELAGKTNYLGGSTIQQWQTSIPNYSRARYQNLYPGIDLDFHGERSQLEYDFIIAPSADPSVIRLHFMGASRLDIDAQGNLVLHTAAGDAMQLAPQVYQQINGYKQMISGRYVLFGDHEVGFELGSYDPTRTLVIDPVMVFSTFLGGTGFDAAYGMAVDSSGAVYLTGWDGSSDFPTTAGSFQSGSTGGFVVKLSPGGDSLIYSAVIPTIGKDIALDSQGNAWVTSEYNGLAGAIYKLNADGSALLYNQSLSGGGATGVAVDGADNAYIVGSPGTAFAPTANAFQTTPGSSSPQAFVMKLDPSGNVDYASYLGNGGDYARDVAVDDNGIAYVTGYTYSITFPTQNPIQAQKAGSYDGFVTAVNNQGTALLYSTYLGGTQQDFAEGIAVDASGSAYVTGRTLSWDFPLESPFQPQLNSGEDAFVTKFAPDGRSLAYSTFLGGGTDTTGSDEAYAIAVDGSGNAVITGRTESPNFPVVDALQASFDGSRDAFVTKFNAAGSGLIYSTYLGGSLTDDGWAIAVDDNGGTYVAGTTGSYDFPTANPLQPTNKNTGGNDAFIAKISETAAAGPLADVSVSMVDSADPVHGGDPVDYTITYTNHGPDAATGIASLIRLDSFSTFVSLSASQGSCNAPGGTNQISCNLGSLDSGASAMLNITVNAPAVNSGSMGSDVFVTANEFDPAITNDADREVTLIADQVFALNVSVTGSGMVNSYNVTGISCPPDCTENYVSGQGVILKAVPAGGSTFDHWAGDCSGTGDCSVTMTANHTVSAIFVGGGTNPTPTLTPTPTFTPTPTVVAADTVTITRAEYNTRKTQLRVEATDSNPSATLQAFVTASDELIGTLSSSGNGHYRGQFSWPVNPQNITLRSSSGGSASSAVTLK